MSDPILLDVPERLEAARTLMLAARAGMGAELAVVIAQSLATRRCTRGWPERRQNSATFRPSL